MTRPWFQIHLSTAIILTFLAGSLLWANLDSYDNFVWKQSGSLGGYTMITFGFPWRCFDDNPFNGLWGKSAWSTLPLLGNIAVNLGSLLVVGWICEHFIRRRESRKP